MITAFLMLVALIGAIAALIAVPSLAIFAIFAVYRDSSVRKRALFDLLEKQRSAWVSDESWASNQNYENYFHSRYDRSFLAVDFSSATIDIGVVDDVRRYPFSSIVDVKLDKQTITQTVSQYYSAGGPFTSRTYISELKLKVFVRAQDEPFHDITFFVMQSRTDRPDAALKEAEKFQGLLLTAMSNDPPDFAPASSAQATA